MKTISVVIPCFNVEQYLPDCIESVLQQSYQPLEIICVDDGSVDATVAIAESYVEHNPSLITLIRSSSNRGASFARNRGMRAARGDSIQFLDADDLLLPDKLKRQAELISGSKDPVLVIGNYLHKARNGEISPKQFEGVSPWIGVVNGQLGCTCSNLWPRAALMEIGGWDENRRSSQEYELMFRLLRNDAKLVMDAEFLTIVRERKAGSISQTNRSENWRRYAELRLDILDHLRKVKADEALINAALQRIFEVIRILYTFDASAAKQLFNIHIRGKYAPRASVSITRTYLLFYRLLGFEFTEKLKSHMCRKTSR